MAYRYFVNKEDLLASVVAQGFGELSTAMNAAAKGPDPLVGAGLAYVEFALQNRRLFRLMFGPILAERAKYPGLKEAASEVFRLLQVSEALDGVTQEGDRDAMAAWTLIHGLSSLFINGLVPQEHIKSLAETTIAAMFASKSERLQGAAAE